MPSAAFAALRPSATSRYLYRRMAAADMANLRLPVMGAWSCGRRYLRSGELTFWHIPFQKTSPRFWFSLPHCGLHLSCMYLFIYKLPFLLYASFSSWHLCIAAPHSLSQNRDLSCPRVHQAASIVRTVCTFRSHDIRSISANRKISSFQHEEETSEFLEFTLILSSSIGADCWQRGCRLALRKISNNDICFRLIRESYV